MAWVKSSDACGAREFRAPKISVLVEKGSCISTSHDDHNDCRQSVVLPYNTSPPHLYTKKYLGAFYDPCLHIIFIKFIFYLEKELHKNGRPVNLQEISLNKTWFMQGNFVQRGCQLITMGRSAGERAVCSSKEKCNRLTRPFVIYHFCKVLSNKKMDFR